MGVASLLLAWALGWPWIAATRAARGLRPRWAAWVLEAMLALALGLGLTAALAFLFLWCGLAPRNAAFAGDGATAAGGLLAWGLSRIFHKPEGEAEPVEEPVRFRWSWLLATVFGVAFVLFVAAHFNTSKSNPQGDWDAWVVWNLRAKFLAHPQAWRTAMAPTLERIQPQMPPLWPEAIARGWLYGGDTGLPAVPVAASLLTSAGVLLLLVSALSVLRTPALGWLGGLLALSASPFWRHSTSQYADFPLALLLLASLVALALAARRNWAPALVALSGALAALGAFTKNDALAACLALLVLLAWVARRALVAWLAGALPVLVLTLSFHALLAPPVAIFSGGQLLQFGRYMGMLSLLGTTAWSLGEIPAHPLLLALALAAALGFRSQDGRRWPLLGAALLCGFSVLWTMATPDPVLGDAAAALDRLTVYQLPLLLFGLLLALRAPEASPEPAGSAGQHEAPPRRPRPH